LREEVSLIKRRIEVLGGYLRLAIQTQRRRELISTLSQRSAILIHSGDSHRAFREDKRSVWSPEFRFLCRHTVNPKFKGRSLHRPPLEGDRHLVHSLHGWSE